MTLIKEATTTPDTAMTRIQGSYGAHCLYAIVMRP